MGHRNLFLEMTSLKWKRLGADPGDGPIIRLGGAPTGGPGHGELQHCVSRGVGHLVEALVAVVDISVAGLMVAGIEGLACRAAEQGCLFRGLDVFGTREQATCGDTDIDERAVVGAPVEGGRLHSQFLLGEVSVDHALDVGRAIGTGGSGVGAVAVIDEAPEVGRANHVEVEVQRYALDLLLAQQTDIMGDAGFAHRVVVMSPSRWRRWPFRETSSPISCGSLPN